MKWLLILRQIHKMIS